MTLALLSILVSVASFVCVGFTVYYARENAATQRQIVAVRAETARLRAERLARVG